MPGIMRYFNYDHLPHGPLRDTSAKVAELARWAVQNIEPSAEHSAGLRKLLEAKDCLVRAVIPGSPAPKTTPAPDPRSEPSTATEPAPTDSSADDAAPDAPRA